jgi:lipopolysaccharide export system permease protein
MSKSSPLNFYSDKRWGFFVLDRYLTREFFFPFILGVGGFTIFGVVDILFYLVDLAILSGAAFSVIFKLLLFKLPAIMVIFFPMASLFATMLLFIRMAKDNELSLLRTSGVNSFRIMYPVLILGVLVSLLSYMVNEKLVPWTNDYADQLIQKELHSTAVPLITANTVFKDSDRFFYIKDIYKNRMKELLIIENTLKYPRLIMAKEGEWKGFKWILTDGIIQDFYEDGSLKYVSKFDELTIHVSQDIRSYYGNSKNANEMDSAELKEKIGELKESGLTTTALQVEYHLKKSVPAMCFIFVLIGIAYCFSFVKTGKDWWGVIISICIAAVTAGLYIFLLALFRALAKDGQIIPILGAWIPNMIYFVIGASLVFYQSRYR